MQKKKPQVIIIGGGAQPNSEMLQQIIAERLGHQVVMNGFQQEIPDVSQYGFNIPHFGGNIDLLKAAIPYTSQIHQMHAENRVGKIDPVCGIEVRTQVVKDALTSIGKNIDINFGEEGNTVDLGKVIFRGVDEKTKTPIVGEFVDYLFANGYVNEEEFQKYRVHILANLGDVKPGGGKAFSF